jgi:hypothetical protein
MSFTIGIDMNKPLVDLVGDAGSSEEIPEGNYLGRITHVKPQATRAGDPTLGLKIATNTGHKFWTSFKIGTPHTAKQMTIALRAGLTVPPANLTTETLPVLVGMPVSFQLKHNKVGDKLFYNVFFDAKVPEEQRVSTAGGLTY